MIPTIISTRATDIPIFKDKRLDASAKRIHIDASHQSCSAIFAYLLCCFIFLTHFWCPDVVGAISPPLVGAVKGRRHSPKFSNYS
jgi:hypothetical protein